MQDVIGVGSALRKARERRSVTLDEASRGTRIRSDSLRALEDERFEVLLGEVYVRAALRTYSAYLGLDPEKVLEAYVGAGGSGSPERPEPPTQIAAEAGLARRRDNHRLAIAVAAIFVLVAAGFGLLSASRAAPEPEALPPSPTARAAPLETVTIGVNAIREVEVSVTVDGIRETIALENGETRTFEGGDIVTLRLPGGVAEVSVNGGSLGIAGEKGKAWERSFGPASVADPDTTPSGAAGSGTGGSTGPSPG